MSDIVGHKINKAKYGTRNVCALLTGRRSKVQLGWPPGKSLDALGDRRMGRKQIREGDAAEQRRNDEQVRIRWRSLHRDALRSSILMFQRAGQSIGIAGHLRASGVGLVFPRPGYRELD